MAKLVILDQKIYKFFVIFAFEISIKNVIFRKTTQITLV